MRYLIMVEEIIFKPIGYIKSIYEDVNDMPKAPRESGDVVAEMIIDEEYLESMSKRTAGQDGIQMDKLKAYPFPLPPIELQDEFADKIEAIEKQKELIKKSISETENLFNARMDYYFN